jgi:hypothetical protein
MADTKLSITEIVTAKIFVKNEEFGNFAATIEYGFRKPKNFEMYPMRINQVVAYKGDIEVVIRSVNIAADNFLPEDLSVGFCARIGENIIVDENNNPVKLNANIQPKHLWVIENKKNGYFEQNPGDTHAFAFDIALDEGQEPTLEQTEAGYQKTSDTTGLFQSLFCILINDDAVANFREVQKMAKEMYDNQFVQTRGTTRVGGGVTRGGGGVTRGGGEKPMMTLAEFLKDAKLACAVKGREFTAKTTSVKRTFVEGSLITRMIRVYVTPEEDIDEAAKKIFGLDQEEEDNLPPPVFKSN